MPFPHHGGGGVPEVLTAAPLLVLRVVAGLLIHVCCITPNGRGAASSTPTLLFGVPEGIACRAQRRIEKSPLLGAGRRVLSLPTAVCTAAQAHYE